MSKAKIVVVMGGNRTGKTEVGGSMTAMNATGVIPNDLSKLIKPKDLKTGQAWCSALTERGSRVIIKDKLDKYLPERFVEKFHGQHNTYYFKGEKREKIGLMTAKSGRDAYQGTSREIIWLDEEHPKDVFEEAYQRTVDCSGRIFFTFSPIEGITWAYDELVLRAKKTWWTENIHGIPEGEGIVHTIEELEKMRDRRLRCRVNTTEGANENIEVFIISKYDNMQESPSDRKPPLEEVRSDEIMLKDNPAMYKARILGRYTRVTGKSVFPEAKVQEIQKQTFNPKVQGDLVDGKFVSNTKGNLFLFKPLDKIGGSKYVIGADTGEGIPEGDFSVAQIIDHYSMEQVGVWYGKLTPERWAIVLKELGMFFNYALIAPERNGIGRATVSKLLEDGYKNVYGYYPDEYSLDSSARGKRKIWGWDMNGKTKPLAEQGLCSSISQDLIKINDYYTCEELFSYIYHPDGKTGALTGCHDDRVTSLMIATEVAKRRKPREGNSGKIYYRK